MIKLVDKNYFQELKLQIKKTNKSKYILMKVQREMKVISAKKTKKNQRKKNKKNKLIKRMIIGH